MVRTFMHEVCLEDILLIYQRVTILVFENLTLNVNIPDKFISDKNFFKEIEIVCRKNKLVKLTFVRSQDTDFSIAQQSGR